VLYSRNEPCTLGCGKCASSWTWKVHNSVCITM
jgi:hypothetical protein